MLTEHLIQLRERCAPELIIEDTLIVEAGADDFDDQGRPIVDAASLTEPGDYAGRFEQLLRSGYAWINLSYYGLLEAQHLVCVELPKAPAGCLETSVNYSGPSKRVREARCDARAAIRFRGT